ncbi:chromosome partitioning protein [Caulobacter ginsengisoli]|uniref:Chromosome partitioning protein n=1 Tax=Caulobacter ginsengisoli TaxID=400775 RepID=A0ABU0IP80_9CAUL|nr:division plane positioning ATPase MipZ [Caulobacter ginsengisoli]MDQ0462824.1 chromosome partitioning protein [Caulobacter ginsengisoli]
MNQPRVIVVGNEKGGAGKSTIAVHLATALLHGKASVAVIDLDLRQASTSRFFANRAAWIASNRADLPQPLIRNTSEDGVALALADADTQMTAFAKAYAAAKADAEFVIIDTPGGDTVLSRSAHALADLIVTPMNDSFVDFDMLGHVDPVTLELLKPSLYAETVWQARKERALAGQRQALDWLVLQNRLGGVEARNKRRVDQRLHALAKRIGFRVGPGLRDRVIYRELFPYGLTIADLSTGVRPAQMSLAHVAARQELRALMQATGLGAWTGDELLAAE